MNCVLHVMLTFEITLIPSFKISMKVDPDFYFMSFADHIVVTSPSILKIL